MTDTDVEHRVGACRHALARGEHRGAAAMLHSLATPLCESGQVHRFLELVAELPATVRDTDLRLLLRTGEAWTELAEWQRAASCYQRAYRLATGSGDPRDLARTLTAQGVLGWYRGDIPGARPLLDRAGRLLSAADEDDRAWDELREGRALVHSADAELPAAEALLRKQLRTFQRRADAEGQRHVLANTAVLVSFRRGDFDNAEALLQESYALARQHGLRLGLPRTANCLSFVLNWQGRHQEALGHARAALRGGHELRIPHIVGFAEYNQAVALHGLGEQDTARAACHRALRTLPSGSSTLLRADVLLAQARLRRPHSARLAAGAAEAAVDVARMQQDQWTLGVCLLELARVSAQATAGRALEEARAVFERYGDRYQLLRWRLAAADHAHRSSAWDGLAGHLPHLLTDMCRYPALSTTICSRLAVLLPAAAGHGAELPPPSAEHGSAWTESFAGLAARLLPSPDERLRTWVLSVLAHRRESWAYELLAAHHDPVPELRTLAEDALATAEPPARPRIDVRCLGTFEARLEGRPVPPRRWASLHAQLILVHLTHVGPTTREGLLELLWPEEDPHKTEARLRTTMRLLRNAIRPPWHPDVNYVTHRGGLYSLASEVRAGSDAQRFEAWIDTARRHSGHLRRHACEQAIAAYGGDFLPGWNQEWVRRERERLRLHWLWAMEEHARALIDLARPEEAEELARRVITSDDLRERAWRVLLRALQRQGRHAEAARCYTHLVTRLRDALDVAPAPATRHLAAELTSRR